MSIQFTDYRRFFASVGLVLISMSVILPWLTLKEPLFIDIKSSEVAELTALGQYNIMLRQFMALSLSILSCCVSPIFLFGGFALLIVSVPMWMLKEINDEGQDSKIKRLEKEVKDFEFSALKNKDLQIAQEKEFLLRKKLRTLIENYLPKDHCEILETEVEDLIAHYDFVIHFRTNISSDILVRVTYAKAHPNIKIFEKRARLLVAKLLKRPLPSRVVVIVLHENLPHAIRKFLTLKQSNTVIQDLSEHELDSLACESCLRLLFPRDVYPQYPWEEKKFAVVL